MYKFRVLRWGDGPIFEKTRKENTSYINQTNLVGTRINGVEKGCIDLSRKSGYDMKSIEKYGKV